MSRREGERKEKRKDRWEMGEGGKMGRREGAEREEWKQVGRKRGKEKVLVGEEGEWELVKQRS